IIALPFLLAMITGCRKTPNFDQLSYQFTVSTSLDTKAKFTEYKTFFISDTVVYVGGVGSDSILPAAQAAQLVTAVKTNLTGYGYTFVPRSGNPDVGLTLTAIKDITVVVSSYPGWWDGYYGCYWYCWGYYYPWTSVYSYTTGTVIVTMYDLKNANHNQQVKAIWNITALGALGSSGTTTIKPGVDGINQGSTQSPYLKTN